MSEQSRPIITDDTEREPVSATRTTFSRRSVLTGVAAGAGAAVLASCSQDHLLEGDLNSLRVAGVPKDPDDPAWVRAPELAVPLGPQDMALPTNMTPAVTLVRVRSMHDGRSISFHLAWDDPDLDDLSIRVDDFRDACAVLLVPGPRVVEVRPMGTATVPATLLHWKADWQRDVDHGRQGLDVVYPNRSVDVYPPLWGTAPDKVDPTTYATADADVWLPGMHVGNPISMGGRTTPVEKLIAHGFSTTTTSSSQDVTGRGARSDTGWMVVITKPLEPTEAGEVMLTPGESTTCAFAVWSGGANEVGPRKAPSVNVHRLFLEG
jgi:hypothetical protein